MKLTSYSVYWTIWGFLWKKILPPFFGDLPAGELDEELLGAMMSVGLN